MCAYHVTRCLLQNLCVCVCFVCSNFTEARERNITARSLRMFFEDSFDYLKDIETFRLTGLTGR